MARAWLLPSVIVCSEGLGISDHDADIGRLSHFPFRVHKIFFMHVILGLTIDTRRRRVEDSCNRCSPVSMP